MAIKYLGSKRVLVPVLGDLLAASEATTALDLFTGTTRVAQEFCRQGAFTTAVDLATYSEVLAQCYVEIDANTIDRTEVAAAIKHLQSLPPVRGYVTETFCEASRYFHPKNGERIDAIREGIDEHYGDSRLRPILLTSLMEAADAVDSTVGLQMAYLKQWAPRALNDLTMKIPEFTPNSGRAVRGDATELVHSLPRVDLAYLDPPYNQHRYFTNYHIWETLVRWDKPEHYGVACKRIDARDPSTKSVFNAKRDMPPALAETIKNVDADVVMVSFSNEGYVPLADLIEMTRARGNPVEVLAFDSKRYVGALIGIYNPSGDKVGSVSHTRNTEYVILSGDADRIQQMADKVLHKTQQTADTLF
ncbi:MAG: DNA adenine methylase [Gordonia sp. (in: high G+C Gram-positive bacteria)]|uniref:DNA adenine methylase n=1 Tax=Gordonia sp. (in: high G+C Gram-positive bacteria) TaxID=84139 RepID=UPI0039E3A32F